MFIFYHCPLSSSSITVLYLHLLSLSSIRPSGNLLAGLQLKPHRNDVVFFELNGLQHGEFPFQAMPTDLQVMELLWSCDSSVLCAWCVRVEGGEETVQLWTVGNYHWYLKQEIHFADSEAGSNGKFTTLVGLLWDPMTPLKLHLLTSGGSASITLLAHIFHSHSLFYNFFHLLLSLYLHSLPPIPSLSSLLSPPSPILLTLSTPPSYPAHPFHPSLCIPLPLSTPLSYPIPPSTPF